MGGNFSPLSPPPNFHQVANPHWVSDFYHTRVPKDSEFFRDAAGTENAAVRLCIVVSAFLLTDNEKRMVGVTIVRPVLKSFVLECLQCLWGVETVFDDETSHCTPAAF